MGHAVGWITASVKLRKCNTKIKWGETGERKGLHEGSHFTQLFSNGEVNRGG